MYTTTVRYKRCILFVYKKYTNHASILIRVSVIRESLQSKGIWPHTLNIIMSSWRESTQRQYGTYLQKSQNFCSRRSVDPISPTISQVLEFFTELYNNNCGYSALNSARSALSALISLPGDLSIGNHPLISRFLKGVSKSGLPCPGIRQYGT